MYQTFLSILSRVYFSMHCKYLNMTNWALPIPSRPRKSFPDYETLKTQGLQGNHNINWARTRCTEEVSLWVEMSGEPGIIETSSEWSDVIGNMSTQCVTIKKIPLSLKSWHNRYYFETNCGGKVLVPHSSGNSPALRT